MADDDWVKSLEKYYDADGKIFICLSCRHAVIRSVYTSGYESTTDQIFCSLTPSIVTNSGRTSFVIRCTKYEKGK